MFRGFYINEFHKIDYNRYIIEMGTFDEQLKIFIKKDDLSFINIFTKFRRCNYIIVNTFDYGKQFIYKDQIKYIKFLPTYTISMIPNDFCYNFDKLEYINDIPKSVTVIYSNFLYGTNIKHNIIIPDNVKIIDEGFMKNCKNFNSNIILSNNLREINGNFLSDCCKFNSTITFGPNIEVIGYGFLKNCISFNQPLDLSNLKKLKRISNYFLYNCMDFNSKIIFPDQYFRILNIDNFPDSIKNRKIIYKPLEELSTKIYKTKKEFTLKEFKDLYKILQIVKDLNGGI